MRSHKMPSLTRPSNHHPPPAPQQTQNICITFAQCWTNVEDVGPTLYKYYTNVLCLLGRVLRNHLQTVKSRDALQSQNALSAYLKSEQILPFGFAHLNSGRGH